MTPDEVRAEYRSALEEVGEIIKVRRYTGVGDNRVFFQVEALARVSFFFGEGELVGALQQGDRRVVVLAEDLERQGFPLPLRSTDKVIVDGREMQIVGLDDHQRKIQGVLAAYQFGARS